MTTEEMNIDDLARHLAYLPNMCLPLDGSLEFDLPFQVRGCYLETYVPSIAFGLKGQGQIRIRSSKEGCILARDGCTLGWVNSHLAHGHGVRSLSAGILPGTDIVIRNDLPTIRVSIPESGPPQRHAEILTFDSPEYTSGNYPEFNISQLQQPATWLAEAWPEEFQDWQKTLQVVVPYKPLLGWEVGGFTISAYQGAAWIHPTTPVATFEHMVHEQSHIKLRYIEEEIPLLESDQDEALFSVGWRSDPRPLIGILEGIYVNIHVMEALSRLAKLPHVADADRFQADHRRQELRHQVEEANSILLRYGRLTKAGAAFSGWAKARAHHYR